jgi:molybdopterin molybdotransferase
MLSVEEAQAKVMAEIAAGPADAVPLAETLGRVLRQEVIASHDLPPSDNSAMDGYAVRAEDVVQLPARLRVTGDIAAGHPATHALEPGTAMRIMTGAFIPDGADAVVQVEWTDGGMDVVTIQKAPARGAAHRSCGVGNARGGAEDDRASRPASDGGHSLDRR